MKKVIIMLTILFVVIIPTKGMCQGDVCCMRSNEISVKINNVNLELSVPIIIIDGSIMLPLRDIFEAMGASVVWEADLLYPNVRVKTNDISISFSFGGYINLHEPDYCDEYISFASVDITPPPCLIDDRTYIPLSAFDYIRMIKTEWDEGTKTIMFTYDVLSRLNGVWVNKAFLSSAFKTDSITKAEKPIIFEISNEGLTHIIPIKSDSPALLNKPELIRSRFDEYIVNDVDDDNPGYNSRVRVEAGLKEIKAMTYIIDGVEHNMVRFIKYDSVVHYLNMYIISLADSYSEGKIELELETILLEDSLLYNEDMAVMRDYYGNLETYIFELSNSSSALSLYEIVDNKKGELKYKLGRTIVE